METQEIDFQFATPHLQRHNGSEHAICTLKNHIIAGLLSTDENFPLNLWDKLVPQCLIMLNLICDSCINPKISAYDQVHGAFYFNRTPLYHPGNQFLVNEEPVVQGTWAPNTVYIRYVGPSLHHNRNFKV